MTLITNFIKKYGATLLLLIVLCFAIGKCNTTDKTYQAAIQTWKTKADSQIQQSIKIQHYIDSLTNINLHLQEKNDTIQNKNNKLVKNLQVIKTKDDSILKVLGQTLPQTCSPALQLAQSYKSIADSLQIVHAADSTIQINDNLEINNLQSGIHRLQISNDSLTKLIITVPVYKAPKILGIIPVPSKPVVFGVGAILGAAVIIIAKH